MSQVNSIALFLVAAFACGALVFWGVVRAASVGAERYKAAFSEQAKLSLEQMFLFIDARQLLTLNALLLLVAGALGWMISGSLVVALALCGVGFFVPRLLFNFYKRRRLRRLLEQFPDATMLISGSLRAGASVQAAIAQMVAEVRPPISQEFDLFLREQRLGVGFEEALDNLEERTKSEDFALFVAALKVSRESGGNLAETMERLADTLRKKLTIEGKIRALTAQGKLQGWIVGLLPVALILVLMQMEPEAMDKLLTTWYGWGTLAFIAVMEIVGALIIRKIVNIDV